MTTEVDQLVAAMRLLRGVALRYDRWVEMLPTSVQAIISARAHAEWGVLRADLNAALNAVPTCPVCGGDWQPVPCHAAPRY